ncbi:phosphoribosyltransferase [Campylobacter sp. RM9344]|uniref:Phosphoribosyltransferase n=1 Tax=Campylobacter californiensis TaxID=1032243 RepID=A0AAW3ZUM9_9BACT|nr:MULTISPECIES: phosphoribosyltransferase family protein [unclassified Campylobacter]MBE2984859.1 phosphoribosyltransferase [Campylobacter sp. RM6883]MBE2986292.1 phosphoribosyltransferase [Campylobacter sp. RM12919]MBE2988077.1 phosphoribosyltransferase [Campylobacter sp. RM12920]MBE2995365.1 phosphoribosyltransferase [Campylobacter sp. RM6913]MBE3022450.1 phosphoribosyltransferase [Campylobacter sp. 7477a]MBE3029300.1 phosphoribosyltransferase [Campylobacter sp. RM9344]
MFYSYEEFALDVQKMAKQINDEFKPEVILAIARGGLTLGHSLAVALENRNLFTLNSIHYDNTNKLDTIDIFNIPNLTGYKKILLVDDIIDSGESMVEIKRELLKIYPDLEIKIATVFYKQKALLLPDYRVKEATEWVEFFWDIHI